MNIVSKLLSKRSYVWGIIIVWILAAVSLSFAPSANDYTVNTGEKDLPEDAASIIANEKVQEYFPADDGLLALLVFSNSNEWNEDNWNDINEISQWIYDGDELAHIDTMMPFHLIPDQAKSSFLSEDGKLILLPATLKDNLEKSDINDTVVAIDEYGNELLQEGELHVTGPAGIASDTIEIFTNADLVLLFSTIGLVLILLIIIYRSPLLAIIPLVAVMFVYLVVDRFLGLLVSNDVFYIETQTMSIVMILLFGVTTDYSLFVFSRFREELRKVENKFEAMSRAIKGVSEPIFFSGSTIFGAMLVLLLAEFGPYKNFAPTFAITIVFVLLAGLTLIPALFALVGRKAFWPAIPKLGEETLEKNRFWGKIASFVTKKPWIAGGIVLLFLIINALNVPTIQQSFNIINSFPEDMKSRIGFEKLEESFHPGELAAVNVILENQQGFSQDEGEDSAIGELIGNLEKVEGVHEVSFVNSGNPGAASAYSEDGKALQLQLILDGNPYDIEALDTLDYLNENKKEILATSSLAVDDYDLYFAGETAKQADVRSLNERDTILVAVGITIVITLMLIWQSRSLIAPIYMMATILLSYLSAMGLSWFLFQNFLGFEEMSSRIPLYSFVFLVALGVDYNIMLISRIREENRNFDMRDAVYRGVALTGGVISSAGTILAATFAVLMTQPIMELFFFGFIVSLGILIDAFIVRGMLVPSIVTILGKWNWWPFMKKQS